MKSLKIYSEAYKHLPGLANCKHTRTPAPLQQRTPANFALNHKENNENFSQYFVEAVNSGPNFGSQGRQLESCWRQNSPNPNRPSLYRTFHMHHSVVLVWLKFYSVQKDVNCQLTILLRGLYNFKFSIKHQTACSGRPSKVEGFLQVLWFLPPRNTTEIYQHLVAPSSRIILAFCVIIEVKWLWTIIEPAHEIMVLIT